MLLSRSQTMRPSRRLLLTAVGGLAASLLAQTQPSALHQVPPGWVDGSKHPEQIPDHASYRLVLIHLSSNLSSIGTRLTRIGLSVADRQVVINEVSLFRANYDQWKVHAGAQPTAQDDAEAKALVLQSRDQLMAALTPGGGQKLRAYVEAEKATMMVKP